MKRVRHSCEISQKNEESIDDLYRRLIGEDEYSMPLPSFGADPHLLTSKVRKHYFQTVIKLLSVNYENSQRLLGKNIRLPSAIWRCAKYIELQAVQACMLMQLYRENIMTVIKRLKADTEKGKLYKNLFECLSQPPINDKSTQVNHDTNTNFKAKRSKRHIPTDLDMERIYDRIDKKIEARNNATDKTNTQTEINSQSKSTIDPTQNSHLSNRHPSVTSPTHINRTNQSPSTEIVNTNENSIMHQISTESQNTEDQVMLEMEKLFQNDEVEDIFEGTLYFSNDTDKKEHAQKTPEVVIETQITPSTQSLDERIAHLSSVGVLAPQVTHNNDPKPKKSSVSKWVCELYYQRLKLSETMDHLIENNRKKHERIRQKFVELFGEDEEEYAIMSPLDETPEFILSCNERIAPFVVKNLMKYYNNGRIKSKELFKGVAKNIMDKIISCDRFPDEYSVYSFITNYFKARPVIRCRADF